MCTGLICSSGSARSNTLFMRTASSSAGTPSSITVRWPTGLMNPVDSPRRRNPSMTPRLSVVLPRFWPVAARYTWRRVLPVRAGLALDQAERVPQSSHGLGVDRVRLEIRAQPFEDVRDETEEDTRIGHEELRLVVVAHERQAALQDTALLDVRDLGREVV